VSAPADWLLDLGHSRVKWGRAEAGHLLPGSTGAGGYAQLELLEQACSGSPAGRIWLSGQSNRESVTAVTTLIERSGLSLHPVQTGMPPLPVEPAYPTLGSDRWLALQWPWQQSRRALCVVDCGTAMTIDLVDGQGHHRGGWILAGLDILQGGLLERARGLPTLSLAAARPELPATDSVAAVASGILLQLTAAIQAALDNARKLLGQKPVLWLTGGDAPALLEHIEYPCQHDPHLVLRGLAMASGVER
jgi:type III pantothenate kinase